MGGAKALLLPHFFNKLRPSCCLSESLPTATLNRGHQAAAAKRARPGPSASLPISAEREPNGLGGRARGTLTDFDFAVIQAGGQRSEAVQAALEVGAPAPQAVGLLLDPPEDFAGAARKVGELPEQGDQRV